MSLWEFLCVQPFTSAHCLGYSSQGLPGADYHNAEVSESSNNISQDQQNEKSATTSDVKSVLTKFAEINLLHNDLVCGILCLYYTFTYMYCC